MSVKKIGFLTSGFWRAADGSPIHVAFAVDDPAFDGILGQLQSAGIAYGSEPNDSANGRVDHPLADRGLCFRTPDGHLFEVMASAPAAEERTT